MERRFRWWSQSGAMSVQTVILIIVVVVIGYLAYKFVPPYVTNYRVQEVFNFSAKRQSDVERRAHLESKLKDIPNSPLTLDDVKFQRDYRTGILTISADYTVEVKLPGGYGKTLVFHPEATSER